MFGMWCTVEYQLGSLALEVIWVEKHAPTLKVSSDSPPLMSESFNFAVIFR